MAETIDELTIQYEEDGKILRKEVAKEVLSKGAWATIMYLYQDLDRKTGEYGPRKISIRRYQKRDGTFQQRSKFEVSSLARKRARSATRYRTGSPQNRRAAHPAVLATFTGTRCQPVRPSYRSAPASSSGCLSPALSVARTTMWYSPDAGKFHS